MKAKSILDLSGDFLGALRMAARRPKGRAPGGTPLVGYPMLSDALAVHPHQVEEARDSAKAKGVPTEFRPDGRPVITSQKHLRDYCRAYGFHQNNCAYS